MVLEDAGTADLLTKGRRPESHKITLYREREIGVQSGTSYGCDLVECTLLFQATGSMLPAATAFSLIFLFCYHKLSEVATAEFWYPV